MSEFITYKTSSPAGDLISFLAGMKEIYKNTGRKAWVYQRLDMPGVSYAEAIHPFENEEKEPVCMNKYMMCMLRPLLLSQNYIQDFFEYKGEEIEFNLDHIRLQQYTNQPNGSLGRWPSYVFPDMATDLSKEWLIVPELESNPHKGKIVINFTQRHRNHILDYHFLKPYQGNIIFAGLQKERDIFCKIWGLDIELLVVKDFLELAQVIKGSKFFMGNASVCFQLAEATKTPRVLETFPIHPNVIPIGKYAYDYYHQQPLQYFFDKLNNL